MKSPEFTAPDGAALDHAVVNVGSRLDEAAETYRRLGFSLTDRGHHTLGSSNHLAIFRTTYLELLGFEPGRGPVTTGLLSGPLGLNALALKTRDSEGLYRDLAASGLASEPPASFSRPVELAHETRDARFKTVWLQPGAIPFGRIFFCEHLTPDLVWRPEWQKHANGAVDVAHVTVAAADPMRSAEAMRRFAGPGAWRETAGGIDVRLGGTELRIRSPESVRQRLGVVQTEGASETDRMVGLGIRSRSLEAAERALAAGGIPVASRRENAVVVAAADALGVVLEFTA
jgi:hypothetical protein